ncbi:MAG: phosphate signaling complex protein PhoU [Maricaulaceae bacterium]|nr:phosphate signaling complex protein PhoU [Maricaulaceae bacterium]
MPGEHIIQALDAEFAKLNELIAKMGGEVESQLDQAVKALMGPDPELAKAVIAADARIDRLEQNVDLAVVRMLALRQPVASDLRNVIAALKVASMLERMGDYAANVAKRSIAIASGERLEELKSLPSMAGMVQDNTRRVLDAYLNRDVEQAIAVWESDRDIDALYDTLYRETIGHMMRTPDAVGAGAHLLFIAKNIERIGDHATNIAEVVYYLVTGKMLVADRPKADKSSYAVVEPKT